MSVIRSHNEWDPIEEMIVGIATGAHFPTNDISFCLSVDSKSSIPDYKMEEIKLGPIPDKVIDETNEDLEVLVETLKKLDIVVKRPKPISSKQQIQTPYWKSELYFAYCPRDIFLVVGETIIETPGMQRSRYFESFCYSDIYREYLQQGAKWISAPKPKLQDEDFHLCGTKYSVLKNQEPIFDAANVIRAGYDLFYLVSGGGNEMGAMWLQNFLGGEYRVHLCKNMYSGLHIDSTISLLKPGLLLANPSRVTKENLPQPLKKWEVIYAPPMQNHCSSEVGYISTDWIGMNLLMLRPDLALVDAHQTDLIHLLKKYKIDVIPLVLRHGKTLGGGFHCVTLDVRRSGQKQDYFN
ncbi:inosamine-phosphate amidinotransferase 1 [Candidatus Uabimicrobium sp. HlEnr_7]|uniref:inosamine-phosphate amidinotransferase 1 n=1 Tax=Candidatus Uabimicrobium helgolandensis TaxID=3095367 RepID=UPI003558902C